MRAYNNRAKLTCGVTYAGSDWVRVDTNHMFGPDEMVVIATPITAQPMPVITRVANTDGRSFDLRLEAPDGSEVQSMPVSWIALAAGVYDVTADNGSPVRFEAFRVESPRSDYNLSLSGQRVPYGQVYENPVVVGQVMSANEAWSSFWARGRLFSDPPSPTALSVGHLSGRSLLRRGPETLGVAVFEAGEFELNGIRISSGSTQITRGADDPTTVTAPLVSTAVVASPAGVSDRFGYWPSLAGAEPDDALGEEVQLRTVSDGTLEASGPETVSWVAANGWHEASRFLIQAGYGADETMLHRVARQGFPDWIEDQSREPVSLTEPYLEALNAIERPFGAVTDDNRDERAQIAIRDSFAHNFSFANEGNPDATNHASIWMRNLVHNDDLLRQRVTFALSQIMVISQNASRLKFAGASMASYWDMLGTNALGNFRDLLGGVAFHPAMAYYLSHIGNRKADPAINQFPDENFAREVMQLFSIGLWELNPDGTRQLDADGEPIPTYDNDDITNLARVFTGLWYEGHPFGEPEWLLDVQGYDRPPLAMFEEWHDTEPKVLFPDKPWRLELTGADPGMAEVNLALDALVTHPNTGPFIAQRLIQFLTVSNPTPGYIARVAETFADNGSGVRGDMLAVVSAVLLDPEARGYYPERPDYGKLLEPIIRFTRMVKAFGAGVDQDILVFWRHTRQINEFGQFPLNSPSVFNFFEPGYQHQGPLSDAGVLSPELQIHNPVTAITMPNELARMIDYLIQRYKPAVTPEFAFDFTAEIAVAADAPALIERLDTLLCAGQMTTAMRDVIHEAVDRITPDTESGLLNRVRLAVWLCAVSPDAAVLV